MSENGATPEIATPRLIMRGHGLADIEDSASLWMDPRTTRFIGGKPSTREEVWARLYRHAGQWRLLGYGPWIVRERSSGRFIGEVGFLDAHREIEPALRGAPELGWVVSPAAQGQGFASEAAAAAIAWGDARFDGARTVCLIDPENRPSLRVAEKCGYREAFRTHYRNGPVIILER